MNKPSWLMLGSCLMTGLAGIAAAQETIPPPKVLQILREYLKPGKGGAPDGQRSGQRKGQLKKSRRKHGRTPSGSSPLAANP